MKNRNKEDSNTKQKMKWVKTWLEWLAMYFVFYLFPQCIPYLMEQAFPPKEVNIPVEHTVIDTDVLNGVTFSQPLHDCPPQKRHNSPILDDQGLLSNSAKYPKAKLTVEFDPLSAIGNNGSNASSASSPRAGESFEGVMLDFRDLYWEVNEFAPLDQLPSLPEVEHTTPLAPPLDATFDNNGQKDETVAPLPNEQFTFDPKIFEEQGRIVPHRLYAPDTESCFNVELPGNSSDWCSPETLVF